MAALPDDQIAGIALNVGFTGNDLTVAVAVALAESGGNPKAHNTNAATGDNSYGLMQINMLGSMGPARRKQFGLSSNGELFNPTTNMRVAYAMWKSSGWSPWSTWKRGSHMRYMNRARIAVQKNGGRSVAVGDVKGGTPTGGITRVDTPLPDNIENAIYDLYDAMAGFNSAIGWVTNRDNWLRVGMFVGGAALVLVGLVMFVGQSKAARVVAGAVPVGKAVRVAKGVI